MINFEQYLSERKGSSAGQQTKRKVNIEQLKEMIANKDSDIADVDVSEIKDMFNLFFNSDFGGSWTADLSGWDTSKVERMENMFMTCENLTKVELLYTGSVTNMKNMFFYCKNLKEVSLPHTESVATMGGMFVGCEELTKVELPNSKAVTDMENMFIDCKKLTKVTIDNIGNVTNMNNMFNGCRDLLQDFSKWDVEGKEHRDMFKDCAKMWKHPNYYPKNYEGR